MTIPPDTKDWTWVLQRRCEECGFDAQSVDVTDLPELIHDNTRAWSEVLRGPDVVVRPAPHIWSPLEYACHVRDVHRLFDERVALMLAEDDPEFADWDQDAAAVEKAYREQDPGEVGAELVEAAAAVARRYATVTGGQWQRPGRRNNGSRFTVGTLGRYHLHDIVHHVYDVS